MDQMDAELKRFAKVRDFALVFFHLYSYCNMSSNLCLTENQFKYILLIPRTEMRLFHHGSVYGAVFSIGKH